MRNWAAEALDEIGHDQTAAMVTVIAAEGSTPREAGARMIVGRRRLRGTIGGGNLEYRATDQARRLLDAGRGFAVQDYPLGPFLQQCCGGHVRLLIERLDGDSVIWLEEAGALIDRGLDFGLVARFEGAQLERSILRPENQWVGRLGRGALEAKFVVGSRGAPSGRPPGMTRKVVLADGDALIERVDARLPTLTVFGAGHVGQAIARQFATLPFRLECFDSRPEAAAPGVSVQDEARLIEIAGALGGDDLVLILTHNHELDYRLTRAVLAGDFRFCGLIGSRTKRVRFINRLRADGVPQSVIAGLTCPIGITSLKSKAPEVIAVAVAAQLLEITQKAANAR